MEWMLMPLQRYADFQGRSRRMEYWMFSLLVFLVFVAWGIVFAILGGFTNYMESGGSLFAGIAGIWAIVAVLAYLAILVPALAVQVRRFHDRDMSGWFVLLNFIPYVGGLIVFVFMVLEGTRGPNRFGPDPKDPNGSAGLEDVFH